MLASYPHSRVTSSTAAIYGGNRRRGGAIAHRDGGIIHGGGRIGRTGGYLGPFTAQVNPTGGSPGGPPTLPPIGPSCAGTGYHYQQRGPREHSQARGQNHGVNVQTLPTRRREQMPPPSIPTSPHQKAKKSHYQQHAVSYNPDMTIYCGLEELGLVAVLPGFAPLPDLAPLPDIGDFLNDTPPVIAYGAVAANPRRLARACGTNAS